MDSGLERTGYAFLKRDTNEPILEDFGCISTSRNANLSKRIIVLAEKLQNLVDLYKPEVIVLERLFFSTNHKTAISVAQAQGVTIYIAALSRVPIEFLAPLEIKQAITGDGRADKKQVEKMVKITLGLKNTPRPDDVVDAIACGLSYLFLNQFKRLSSLT